MPITYRYAEDAWRWFWDEQERWYCSYDCAMCDGAYEPLYRIDSDHHWPEGDEDNISIKCPSCNRYFLLPRDWEYQMRKHNVT